MCSAFHSAIGAFAALALACAPEPADARQIRVCADPNNLPFSNDRREGFENRIVELIAGDLGAEVSYAWWAQRRGALRAMRDGACDLIPGMVSGTDLLRTTSPYYRSTYVFVTRPGSLDVASLNDGLLRTARVGVQLVGDDGFNTPPAHALSRRGLVDNVRGYSLYGDYREADPPSRIIRAVAEGEIDVAVAWGPLGGYFAALAEPALAVKPVLPAFDGPKLPMVFDISMAVRKQDLALRDEVDAALARRRSEIDRILAEYRVPRADLAAPAEAVR